LGPEHTSSEIFPPGYTALRKDRQRGGGGVFILLKDNIEYIEGAFDNFRTDCEVIWAQIKLPGSKLLNIASLYQPPNVKIEYLNKLQEHLHQVYGKFKNATYILGGDFNLTRIDWTNDAMLSDQPGQTNDANHCSVFLEILNDMGLSQHCLEVTRPVSNKILDLILTTSLIQFWEYNHYLGCQTITSFSQHSSY
jgi:hypothetical protein